MALQLNNATVGYDKGLIQDISAELELGDICLMIGNNGVGKTTLIKSLLNQVPLLSGEIFINGNSASVMPPRETAEHIAVVFSKSQVPAGYTTQDLIALGKYIHYPYYFSLKESDRQEVAGIISSLNLARYAKMPLAQLSDGNLQKAFIGRALAQNSPIIILDEPTTHLDEKNKIMILKFLRHLAKRSGKLILFSSHDWRLAKEFADKIWYVKDCALHSGLAEEVLYNHPELMDPSVFALDQHFLPPEISAPPFEKELLFSLLQKNLRSDLSKYHFIYNDSRWLIYDENTQSTANSFEEVLQFVEKRV